MTFAGDGIGIDEADLLDLAQVDAVDDQRGEVAAQYVVALLADGDDLHRLAVGQQPADVLARETGDLRVEAAAQPALGRADDQQMDVVLAGSGHQRRRLAAAADRLR